MGRTVFYILQTIISHCFKQVVVLTDTSIAQQLEINDYTHSNGIKFIAADVRGLFSSTFCDFGPKFPCIDPNGENPVQGMVVEVEKVHILFPLLSEILLANCKVFLLYL